MGERLILDDAQRAIAASLAGREDGLQGVDAERVFAALERGGGHSREGLEAAADRLCSEGLLIREEGALKLTPAGYLCAKHDICGPADDGPSSGFVL